ncbi:MAG: choice-of-anchor T family protein [Thermoplasmatota archaeon]
MDNRSWLPCLTVILLISISFGVLFSDNADATGAPAITITLSQTKQTVYITEEEYSNVTFTGTVIAQIPALPPGQVLVVDLNVQEEDYQWIFDPEELIFTESGEELPFELDLWVGKMTPAGQNTVSIGARWSYSPGVLGGTVPPSTAIIEVTEYPDGVLDAPNTFTVAEGITDQLDFFVMNTGNVDTRYILEYDGVRDAENLDVEILGLVDTLDVSFDDEEAVTLTLIASDVREGDEFTLEITLMNADMEVFDTASIQIVLVEEAEPPPPDDDEPDDDDTPPPDDDEPDDDDTPPGDDDEPDDDVPSDDDDVPNDAGAGRSGFLEEIVSGMLFVILAVVVGIVIVVSIVIYVIIRITRKG